MYQDEFNFAFALKYGFGGGILASLFSRIIVSYASELTNTNPEYEYTRQKSLEINSDHKPELVKISKYGTVLYSVPDQPANVTYKHYEIGFQQTLLQFTWMTPKPDDERLNKEIELILESAEIR